MYILKPLGRPTAKWEESWLKETQRAEEEREGEEDEEEDISREKVGFGRAIRIESP